MSEPLIGLWWYTDENELIGLRQSVSSGVTLTIWVSTPYIHEISWDLAVPHTSKYHGRDSSNYSKGWVVYNTCLNRYYVLSEDIDLLSDGDFCHMVIKEFHLDNARCTFEYHGNMKDKLKEIQV